MQDLPTVLDADTTDTTFGLGATFSANQLWVASYDMTTTKPVLLSTSIWLGRTLRDIDRCYTALRNVFQDNSFLDLNRLYVKANTYIM